MKLWFSFSSFVAASCGWSYSSDSKASRKSGCCGIPAALKSLPWDTHYEVYVGELRTDVTNPPIIMMLQNIVTAFVWRSVSSFFFQLFFFSWQRGAWRALFCGSLDWCPTSGSVGGSPPSRVQNFQQAKLEKNIMGQDIKLVGNPYSDDTSMVHQRGQSHPTFQRQKNKRNYSRILSK